MEKITIFYFLHPSKFTPLLDTHLTKHVTLVCFVPLSHTSKPNFPTWSGIVQNYFHVIQ